METIKVNKIKYYQLDDIIDTHIDFGYGSSSNTKIVEKNNVPKDEYIYAIKKDNKWIKMNRVTKNIKILISKTWFNDNYDFENEIKIAPDILKIDNDDMFNYIDENGDEKYVEIEMRGDRKIDNCYFSAEDIGNILCSKSTINAITKASRDAYTKYKDYIHFYVLDEKIDKWKRKLFLTYHGLTTLLRNSRNKIAKDYVEWSNTTLFTIKHGKTKDKIKIAANILKADKETVTYIIGKCVNSTPCIYLFSLGTVKKLRKQLGIGEEFDDDDLVYKLGRAVDLKKRCQEHEYDYGKLKGAELSLETYGWIDPRYLVDAENQIKKYMNENNYVIDSDKTSYTELVAISKKYTKEIKKLYTEVANKYAGMLNDVRTENSNLKKELEYSNTIIKTKDNNIDDLKDNINNLKDNINNLKDNIKSKGDVINLLQNKIKK